MFWNIFGTCYKLWTFEPRIYHQNTSKIQNIWDHPWKYYFQIWESGILKRLEGPCTFWTFQFWEIKPWNLFWELWKFEIRELIFLQFWKFESWQSKKHDNLKLANLNVLKFKIWNPQHPSTYRLPPLHWAGGVRRNFQISPTRSPPRWILFCHVRL